MTSKLLKYLIIVLQLVGIYSCTGTRHLSEGEYLARNGKIEISDRPKFKEFPETKLQLNRLAEVNQNSKLLWMRIRLSIHNSIKEPKEEKGFGNWMKNKIGKPPVIYNENQTKRIELAMEEYLFNNSFFHSQVSYSVEESKYERKPIYTVSYGESYTVDSLAFLETGKPIDKDIYRILNNYKNTLSSSAYSLENIISRREDLAFGLMNNGYYYFRPSYIEFIADTIKTGNKVRLTLKIKRIHP